MARWSVDYTVDEDVALAEVRARYNIEQKALNPGHVDLTDAQYFAFIAKSWVASYKQQVAIPRGRSERELVDAYKNLSAADRAAINSRLGW